MMVIKHQNRQGISCWQLSIQLSRQHVQERRYTEQSKSPSCTCNPFQCWNGKTSNRSGWPSRGHGGKNGPFVPSVANERTAIQELNCASSDNPSLPIFAFEYDDQLCKSNDNKRGFGIFGTILARFHVTGLRTTQLTLQCILTIREVLLGAM